MRMARFLVGCFVCTALLVSGASVANGQDEATVPDQIRNSAAAFKKAFDKHNAKALAKMWTEDGEYVNENGRRFSGRDAIKDEYAAFFAANPAAKIELSIDSIRVLNDSTVLEEGRATVTPASGAPAGSRYTAIHVKVDDGWQMASVRDEKITIPSAYPRLQDLGWLVGNWSSEHEGIQANVSCNWIAQKSYLERKFEIRQNGQLISSSREIIGWDPLQSQVVSWSFASGGGRSIGVWSEVADGWIVQQEGVSSDGVETAAINIWSPLADDAIGWRSVIRTHDGQVLQPARDVVLRRTENQ